MVKPEFSALMFAGLLPSLHDITPLRAVDRGRVVVLFLLDDLSTAFESVGHWLSATSPCLVRRWFEWLHE